MMIEGDVSILAQEVREGRMELEELRKRFDKYEKEGPPAGAAASRDGIFTMDSHGHGHGASNNFTPIHVEL